MTRTFRVVACLAALVAAVAAQSATFTNGVDGYIDVPANASLVPAGGITIEAWITYNDATIPTGTFQWPTLLRKNVLPAAETYFIRVDAGSTNIKQLRFKIVTTTGQFSAPWTFAAGALTAWTHIAATFDGASVKLYVNGAQVATAAASGTIVDTGGVLRIGKGDPAGITGAEVWNGSVDALRLWPYARTAAEISADMLREVDAIPLGVSTWNFTGSYADSSGANHGTASGSVGTGANAPGLISYSPSGLSVVAPGTAGCSATLGGPAVPAIGSAAVGVIWRGAPANGAGTLALTPGLLPAPIPVLGMDVWVDVLSPFSFLFPVSANAAGLGRMPFPLPPDPGLVGLTVYLQVAWPLPCGPAGFGASNALQVTVLP